MNHVVSDNLSAVWMVLSNDDVKLAQKQEDDKYMSHRSDSADFVCVRCGEKMMSLSALKSHTLFRLAIIPNWHCPNIYLDVYRHGVQLQDFRKEDYQLDLDAAIQPPFSIMIQSDDSIGVIDLVTPPSSPEPHLDNDDLYV